MLIDVFIVQTKPDPSGLFSSFSTIKLQRYLKHCCRRQDKDNKHNGLR